MAVTTGLALRNASSVDVPVVFIERDVHDRSRTGIERDQMIAADGAGEHNPVADAGFGHRPLGKPALRPVADDNQAHGRRDVG